MNQRLARLGLAAIVMVSALAGPGAPGRADPALVNGSFSEPYLTWNIDGRNEYVAHGWTPFIDYYDNPPGPPEFMPNYQECRDGFPSQWVWSTYNSYRCGLHQTIGGFTPGEAYTFQVWILSIYGAAGGPPVPGDNIGKQLAVDLYGGTDWLAPTLFRGAEDFRDRRAYFAYVSFTAETPTATLFIHINNRWPGENCQALWDEALLYPSPVTTTDQARVAPLPPLTPARSFPVYWGLAAAVPEGPATTQQTTLTAPPPSPPVFYSYDVQYQVDGGPWTTWLTNTLATSATFGLGAPTMVEEGRTYAFRCRAHDASGGTNEGRTWGWVEAYPATPDAQTTIGQPTTGRVQNNALEGAPGVVATLAGPAAVTATTGAYGEFQAFTPHPGVYALTITPTLAAQSYGPLPPAFLTLPTTVTLELLLPPADDVVQNGDFEGSDPLAGWHVGGAAPPTVTANAHTGHAAARLGSGEGLSWLTQTIFLSDTLISPTLSFAYAYRPAAPTDTFDVWVQGISSTVTVTQATTPTGWTYVAADLSGLTGTATLHLQVRQSSAAPTCAWVDEVRLGARARPFQRLYLPLAQRAYPSP